MEIGAIASSASSVYQAPPPQAAAEGSAAEEASEAQSEKTREAALRAQTGNTFSVTA